MLERSVELAFVNAVERHDGAAYKFTSPGRRGVPDRIVLIPGHRLKWGTPPYSPWTCFAELKRPVGSNTAEAQKREHKILRALGYEVFVLRTVAMVLKWEAEYLR